MVMVVIRINTDKKNSSKTHKNKSHEARGLYVMQNSSKSQEAEKPRSQACGSNCF